MQSLVNLRGSSQDHTVVQLCGALLTIQTFSLGNGWRPVDQLIPIHTNISFSLLRNAFLPLPSEINCFVRTVDVIKRLLLRESQTKYHPASHVSCLISIDKSLKHAIERQCFVTVVPVLFTQNVGPGITPPLLPSASDDSTSEA